MRAFDSASLNWARGKEVGRKPGAQITSGGPVPKKALRGLELADFTTIAIDAIYIYPRQLHPTDFK